MGPRLNYSKLHIMSCTHKNRWISWIMFIFGKIYVRLNTVIASKHCTVLVLIFWRELQYKIPNRILVSNLLFLYVIMVKIVFPINAHPCCASCTACCRIYVLHIRGQDAFIQPCFCFSVTTTNSCATKTAAVHTVLETGRGGREGGRGHWSLGCWLAMAVHLAAHAMCLQ